MSTAGENIQSQLNKRLEAQLRLKRFFNKLLSETQALDCDQISFACEDQLVIELFKDTKLRKKIKIKADWFEAIADWLRQRWCALDSSTPFETRSAKHLETFALRIRIQDLVVQGSALIHTNTIQLGALRFLAINDAIVSLGVEDVRVQEQFRNAYEQETGVVLVAARKRSELARLVASTLGHTTGYYGGDIEDKTVRKVSAHLGKKELIVVSAMAESLPALLAELGKSDFASIREVLSACFVGTYLPRLCEACAKVKAMPSVLQNLLADSSSKVSYKQAKGCGRCDNKGFHASVLLQQGIYFSEDVGALYQENPTPQVLEQYLQDAGYQSFTQLATAKAAQGLLSLKLIQFGGIELPQGSDPEGAAIVLEDDFFVSEEDAQAAKPRRDDKASPLGTMPNLIKGEDEALFSDPEAKKKTTFDVLLVEDDLDQRNILELVLTEAGYVVRTAENGVDALEELTKEKPDLVVADIMMPQMNGEEMIARMKSDSDLQSIPILVLTVLSDSDREYALLDLGVDEYCEKTIQRKLLLKRIENLMRRFYAA